LKCHAAEENPKEKAVDTALDCTLQFIYPGGDSMIHFVLHDAKDTVAVVVVEGVKTGDSLTGWIMDEDKTVQLQARQDIPIGHKIALRDMAPGDTVWKYGIDMGKVVAPIQVGQHAHVHNIKTKRW
jgi:(2R)-sulfolactate sulfo-lyase subunit alpha